MTVDQFKRLDERLDVLSRCVLASAVLLAEKSAHQNHALDIIEVYKKILDGMMTEWPHKG